MNKYEVLGSNMVSPGIFKKFNFYVIANNKMDAVRTFKEKYRFNRFISLSYDNNRPENEMVVRLYKEPIFEDRCYDYDE